MLEKEQLTELKKRYSQKGLSLENERAKTRLAYEEHESREQLKRLLVNCKLFSKIETQEQLTLRNFAISILQDMGFFDESNVSLIIDYFFSLPVVGELKENKE